MSTLTRQIVIDAPAGTVREVIAGRFDRISEWATAILASSLGVADTRLVNLDAPIAVRVCETGIRALPQVTETIVVFDASNRSLTYQTTGGMPAFVTAARNTWDVTTLTATRCRVHIAAEFATRGLLGRLARPVILGRVLRDGRHLLHDLKHHVETGTPTPRKLSRQSR